MREKQKNHLHHRFPLDSSTGNTAPLYLWMVRSEFICRAFFGGKRKYMGTYEAAVLSCGVVCTHYLSVYEKKLAALSYSMCICNTHRNGCPDIDLLHLFRHYRKGYSLGEYCHILWMRRTDLCSFIQMEPPEMEHRQSVGTCGNIRNVSAVFLVYGKSA